MHMHIIKGLAGGCLGAKGLSHLFYRSFSFLHLILDVS